MRPTVLYRIASVLLILFAAGHTLGFLRFKAPSPEGRAVWDAMNTVHFQVARSSFSYAGFYIGFGLFVTVYLLFAAYLAWHLGALGQKDPHAIGFLGWAFFVVQLATLVLSWIYFSAAPVIFSAVVLLCVGWAAWLVNPAGKIEA